MDQYQMAWFRFQSALVKSVVSDLLKNNDFEIIDPFFKDISNLEKQGYKE
jgi:hypothetical protein